MDNIALHTQVAQQLAAELPDFHTEIGNILSSISNKQMMELQEALQTSRSLDDAYTLLGESAGPGALGVNPLEAGKQLFLRSQHKIVPLVCGSPVIRAYCTRRSVIDTTTAATLVAGVLTQHHLAGWNISALTCLLLRAGLSELCHVDWSKP